MTGAVEICWYWLLLPSPPRSQAEMACDVSGEISVSWLPMRRRSRVLLLLAWLAVAAAAAVMATVRSSALWLTSFAGAVAAVGSLLTIRVGKALDREPVSSVSARSEVIRLHQLPPSVGDFTGRMEVSRRLRALLSPARPAPAVVISAVAGQGGIGKTALAIQLAHELAPRFPDGQMYVNLRGYEKEQSDPGQVLADLLRDLDVEPPAIPDRLEARARLYRDRLAGRRVLIVLDNARDERQVRPLLPRDRSCAVLITSRSHLAGLEAATTVELETLPVARTLELLAKVAGRRRVVAEPEEARAIVEACGCLPLAVRVAGARLGARPGRPLRVMAERLSDARHRLDELTAGDLDVRATLALSCDGQPPEVQRAFRLLGLVRAADFAAWPLAAVLDVSLGHADNWLRSSPTLSCCCRTVSTGLASCGTVSTILFATSPRTG